MSTSSGSTLAAMEERFDGLPAADEIDPLELLVDDVVRPRADVPGPGLNGVADVDDPGDALAVVEEEGLRIKYPTPVPISSARIARPMVKTRAREALCLDARSPVSMPGNDPGAPQPPPGGIQPPPGGTQPLPAGTHAPPGVCHPGAPGPPPGMCGPQPGL